MRTKKKNQLERAGFRVGTVAEFLNLSPEESAFVELKATLADHLVRLRAAAGMTQAKVARQLGTSQARVARMEAADRSVSIDLLVRALFSLGTTRQDLGRMIGTNTKKRSA